MRRLILLAFLLLVAVPARAQTTWEMATEYPATAIVGEGLTHFASEVQMRLKGSLVIKPAFASATKSAAMIDAVASGKLAAGDAFGGAMAAQGTVFALSSLPFNVTSIEEARKLADRARPHYEKALAAKALRLLYVTGWPPSGIWSKAPIAGVADLKGLSIRTYDATSTRILDAVGAKAHNLSFNDVMGKLADGSVTAVLSSGDGGAGRQLWKYLPHFSAVSYAIPLSFAFVRNEAFAALTDEQRKSVEAAARDTEAHQWRVLGGRLEQNYATMRANGVTIAVDPPRDVANALRTAAASEIAAWRKAMGEAGAGLASEARPQ